jgi:prepilin-type N-terminal cleavage/methylation domain-containing protein
MSSRGMTLIELLVGVATAAIIASILAKVLLLGMKTYDYSSRQTASLTRTRKALTGDGVRTGILGSSRGAYAFSTVSSSSVTVLSSSTAVATTFYVTKGKLYRTKSGSTVVQADSVNGITFNYYQSTNGIISSTTVASSATMVTALVSVTTGTASSGAQNAYSLFSGAQLRDHQ